MKVEKFFILKIVRQILALTSFFFKLAVKQRSSSIFIIIATLSIAVSISISGIDIGDKKDRLFIDATIFIQSSILTIIALFFSINFLEKERRSGIFITPLSSGISREIYYASIISSQISILFTVFMFFGVINIIFIIIFHIDLMIVYQLFLTFLSSTILATLVIMLGQYFNPLKAMIYSILIYFFGNGLDELYIYSYQLQPDDVLQILYRILSRIIPNFYIFDDNKFSFFPIIHTFTQIGIISTLGYLGFKNRVLRVEN